MKKFIILIVTAVSTTVFGQVGINTENPQGIFNIDGGKNNATTGTPTPEQQKDDFVVLADGSVGIGTTQPHASAILELNVDQLSSGSKKGFLGPKVALTSNTDIITIPNPAVGLLVYNLGTETTFPVEGFLYWNGSEWIKFGTRTSVAGEVEQLNCNNATLFPKTYQAGVFYEGVMKVPYRGGNGGSYSTGSPIQSTGVTGLTAVLQAGDLEYGSGELIYNVTGTPSASAPNTATFAVSFGAQTCSAIVGENEIIRGESEYFSGGNLLASATDVLFSSVDEMPTVENTLRFDVYANRSSNAKDPISIIPRVYNISDEPVKIWWQGLTSIEGRGDGNVLLAPGGYQDLDNGMYLGYGRNDVEGVSTPRTSVDHANDAEGYSFDFIFKDKWYRVEMSFLVDNMNTTNNADNIRKWFCVITRMY